MQQAILGAKPEIATCARSSVLGKGGGVQSSEIHVFVLIQNSFIRIDSFNNSFENRSFLICADVSVYVALLER